MSRRDGYAVSEILGLVYIVMISTTLICAIYVWAPQELESKKTNVRAQSTLNQFEMIDDVIVDLVGQGIGSSRTASFVADKGYMQISSYGTRFILYYPLIPGFDFQVSGFDFDATDSSDQNFIYTQTAVPSIYSAEWRYLQPDDKTVKLEFDYDLDGVVDETVEKGPLDPYPIQAPSFIQFYGGYYDYTDYVYKKSGVWDFGDGSPLSTGEDPLHRYENNGVYTVWFNATDETDSTLKGSDRHDVVVGVPDDPHAAFTFFPVNPTTGMTVYFYNESTSPDNGNAIVSLEWEFGDGTETSSEENPTHVYNSAGPYSVNLTVNKSSGPVSSITHEIVVRSGLPTANFTYTKQDEGEINRPGPGGEIDFTNTSTDPDGDPLSHYWDFGDGTTTTEKDPTHTYAEEGVYTVALTVSDDDDGSDTRIHDVVVINDTDPLKFAYAAFSYYPTNPWNYEYVTFYDESKNRDGNPAGDRTWTFSTWPYFGYDANITHRYLDIGQYSVKLTARFNQGGNVVEDTIDHEVIGKGTPPSPDFYFYQANEWPISVGVGNALAGAAKIDVVIKKQSCNPYYSWCNYGPERVVAGRIWIFDVGCIKYKSSSGQTERKVILENGAILSTYSDSGFVSKEPKIYDEYRMEGIGTGLIVPKGVTRDLIINIIQLDSSNEITIGPGRLNLRFILKYKDGGVREKGVPYYTSLKMQIFGDQESSWINFFKFQHDFKKFDFNDETLFYYPGGYYRTFMLGHSIFELDLEVLG